MEEDLVVISRSIVIPRNVKKSTSVKKIHLTPWDLSRLRFGYLQRGLLFPKPDPKIDIILSRLQTSLSVALDRFYPLAGRLVKLENDDDTVSFFISCDGSGVEFVHAMARNIEVSDVLRLSGSVPGFFSSFFPATGIKNYNGVSRSLLMVQVTEMKDGIFLGFGYNSTVADGNSIWTFFNAWSEICSIDSGSETFQRLLHLKGWFFDGIDCPIHIPDPEIKTASYAKSTNLQEKMFHLTKENALKLEAKANDEADQKISSIQAVLGQIWRSMIKHSGMSREEETHCRLPINMRRRLNPPLEAECFGNVSQTGIATVTVGELLDHGLGWAAVQIKKMEQSQTDENAKAFAEKWVKNVKIPVSVGSRDLVVTNSHRFDVYSNDFGWGKPIAARAGPPYLNGRLVVLQGVEEGSLDFQACLQPQAEALGLDKTVGSKTNEELRRFAENWVKHTKCVTEFLQHVGGTQMNINMNCTDTYYRGTHGFNQKTTAHTADQGKIDTERDIVDNDGPHDCSIDNKMNSAIIGYGQIH